MILQLAAGGQLKTLSARLRLLQPFNSPTEVAKIGYLSQNGAIYHFKGKMDELNGAGRLV